MGIQTPAVSLESHKLIREVTAVHRDATSQGPNPALGRPGQAAALLEEAGEGTEGEVRVAGERGGGRERELHAPGAGSSSPLTSRCEQCVQGRPDTQKRRSEIRN